jgi:ParB family chromosome partitioning protein
MSEEDKTKRLGRGLSVLLGEEEEDFAALDRLRASKEVPIELIRANPFQPRHRFDDDEMEALAASIRRNGILQPILVRRAADDGNTYEIVAGERRWRAAQLARLHQIPVVIRELSNAAALEISLVENIQRRDLTPLEEAEGYQRLLEEFEHTQEQLALAIGKSRSHVANMVRLLGLPGPVKEMLDDGRLTAGHARPLLTAPEPATLAREIVAKGLNVRQAEHLARLAQRVGEGGQGRTRTAAAKDPDTVALEAGISTALGLKVTIARRGTEAGEVRIRYESLEQLDDICRHLCQDAPTADNNDE